jgi:hypothetical protein
MVLPHGEGGGGLGWVVGSVSSSVAGSRGSGKITQNWSYNKLSLKTLSTRHVTIVPLGNKTFYWPSGSIYLPAANRNAFYIHVGRQAYVCARDSSYTQLTADT